MSRPGAFPRAVWIVLGGDLASAIGTGATIPYLFVYLHDVAGVALGLVGAIMTGRAVAALFGASLSGPVADRLGARVAAVIGLTVAAAASIALASISSALWALATTMVLVIAANLTEVGLHALLAGLVAGPARERAFTWRRVVAGLGGAGGAGLVTVAISTLGIEHGLRVAYTVDGATFAVFAVLVAVVATSTAADDAHDVSGDVVGDAPDASGDALGPAGAVAATRPGDPGGDGDAGPSTLRGYRAVLADRSMRWICAVVAIGAGAGFAQVQLAIPSLVLRSGADARALGWMTTANMIALVLLPLPLQRVTARWNRGTTLLLPLAAMAASLLLTVPTHAAATALVVVGVLFAVAEMVLVPVSSTLVNDLARADLVGRYNAAQLISWTGGWLVGTVAFSVAVALSGSAASGVLVGCAGVLIIGMGCSVKLGVVLPPATARASDGELLEAGPAPVPEVV